MAAFLVFLLIAVGVGIGILWFYPGTKSDEIKTVLKDAFRNLVDFSINLKKLFLLLKDQIDQQASSDNVESSSSESVDTKNESIEANKSDIGIKDQVETEVTNLSESNFSEDTPSTEVKSSDTDNEKDPTTLI